VVVNNQVGFTTEPADARSSAHATDVAKTIGAPVLQCAPAPPPPPARRAPPPALLERRPPHFEQAGECGAGR
jgi:hypothetical protein